MSVELKDIIKEENIVYKKTPVLTDNVTISRQPKVVVTETIT